MRSLWSNNQNNVVRARFNMIHLEADLCSMEQEPEIALKSL